MATSQPSSQSEDQSPQPSSSGYCLEVEMDDETPGPSAPRVEHSRPLHFSGQKRKRELSSDLEEDLEDTPGIFDIILRGDPSRSPQYYKRDWEWTSDFQEELPGLPDPNLGVVTSPSSQSSQENTDWEWSSDCLNEQEEELSELADSFQGVEPSSLPQSGTQKRDREWWSSPQEELSGLANSVPGIEATSPPQSPAQKKKRESFLDPQEEQEDKLPGLADSVLEVVTIPWPETWGQKMDWEWATDFQEELQEELLALAQSVLGLDPSSQPQSPAQKRDRESPSDSQKKHEEKQPGLAHSALGAESRIPPQSQAQKRKRESSESEEELEQEALDLGPEPQHPSWTEDTQCGLKMTPKRKRKRVSSVLPEHHEVFTRLLEDPVVKRFLAWDKKLWVSDKYLLSMVIAYFSRAGLFSWQYRRIHFFLALYIASDMEEDNQALTKAIFSFLYGKSHAQRPLFHRLRLQLVQSMRWNLRVSREECEEIQAYDPGLWVWSRDRTLLPTSPGTVEA